MTDTDLLAVIVCWLVGLAALIGFGWGYVVGIAKGGEVARTLARSASALSVSSTTGEQPAPSLPLLATAEAQLSLWDPESTLPAVPPGAARRSCGFCARLRGIFSHGLQ